MKTRLEALDCLRGIAALAVLLYHYSTRFKEIYPQIPTVDWTVDPKLGSHAVHLFFTISGFVIFMSLGRMKTPLDFIRARFFRLYPAFWAAATFTFLLLIVFNLPGREVSLTDYLVNLTMIPVMLSGPARQIPYVDGVFWTLEMEIFFYVIMLVILYARAIDKIDWIMVGLLVWSLIFPKLPINSSFIESKIAALTLVLSIPYFAAGIYLYRLREKPQHYLKYAALLFLTTLVIVKKFGKEEMISAIVIFGLVFAASRIEKLPMAFKPLTFFGSISYSLYLVHQNLGYVVIREMGIRQINPHVAIFSAFAISVAVAIAICFGIEKPTMALSKRFSTRKSESLKIAQDSPLPEQA